MRSGAFFYAVEAIHSVLCALENAFHVRKKVKHVCLARSFLLPLPSHAGSDVERFMQQLTAYAHDAASGKKQAIALPVGSIQLSVSTRTFTQYGDAFSLNVLLAAMHMQGYAVRVSECMRYTRIVRMQLHALRQRPVSIQGVFNGARQSADRLAQTLWMALQSSPISQDCIVDISLNTARYLVHDAGPLLITLAYIYQSMPYMDDAFGVYWLAWRFSRYPFMQNAYSVACATLWSSIHILSFLSQARRSQGRGLDYQTLLFVANVVTVLFAARRFYHYRQSVTHAKWLSDRTLLVDAMLRVCDERPRRRLSAHGFDAIHDPRAALVFAAYVIIASCSLQSVDHAYAPASSLHVLHALTGCVQAAFYTSAWYIALVVWKEWVADNPCRLNQWLAKKHSMSNDAGSLVCMSYQAVRLLKELSFSAQGSPQLMPAKQPFLLALQVRNTRNVISPYITGIYDAAFGHSVRYSRGQVVTCPRVRRWLHLSEQALASVCTSAYLQGTNQANDDATGAFYRKELSGFLQVVHASRAISEHVKFSQGLSDIATYLRMIHACIHADPDALSWMQALYAPNASVSKQRMARELELFLALYVLKISVGTDADRAYQMQWSADFFWGEVFVTAAVLRIAIERGFCPQRANAQAFDEIIDIVSWLCGLQHAPSWHALACSIDASVLSERLLQLPQSYGPCVRTWGVIDTHYSYAQLSKDVDAMVQSLTKTYVVFSITLPILAGKRAVFIPNRSWSVLWKPRLSLMDRLGQLRRCCFPQSTSTGSRLEVSWQSILLKKQYVDSVWLYVVTCLRARWVYGCAVKELQLICMHAAIARQSFARWRCMQRSPAHAVKKSAKDAVLRRGVTHAKSIMASMVRCLGLLPRLLISVVADASFWLAMASTTACYDGSMRAASGIRACAASAMRMEVSNPLRVFCAATLGLCVASVVMVAQPFVGYGALGVACMIGAVGLWNLVLGGRGVANGAMLKPSVTAVPVIRHGASAIAMQVSSSQLLATAVPAAAPQGVSQGSAPGVAQGIAG